MEPRKPDLPSAEQLAVIRAAPAGYLLRWNYRVQDENDATVKYNNASLVALPTGPLWDATVLIVSPFKQYSEALGMSRVVWAEHGTRRVDAAGHPMRGRVVPCDCPAVDRAVLDRCPPGCETVALDGIDGRAFSGWQAEVLRGALSALSADPAAWTPGLEFPRALLVVRKGARTENKFRRGHLSRSVPPDSEFESVAGAQGGREALDFSRWQGSGVIAFDYLGTGGRWCWAPSATKALRLEGAQGGLLVELGCV